jgi:hypothetical protein
MQYGGYSVVAATGSPAGEVQDSPNCRILHLVPKVTRLTIQLKILFKGHLPRQAIEQSRSHSEGAAVIAGISLSAQAAKTARRASTAKTLGNN